MADSVEKTKAVNGYMDKVTAANQGEVDWLGPAIDRLDRRSKNEGKKSLGVLTSEEERPSALEEIVGPATLERIRSLRSR